jgi:hypothetical protein
MNQSSQALRSVRSPRSTIVAENPHRRVFSGMESPRFPPKSPPQKAPMARPGATLMATVPLDMWVAVPTTAVGTMAVWMITAPTNATKDKRNEARKCGKHESVFLLCAVCVCVCVRACVCSCTWKKESVWWWVAGATPQNTASHHKRLVGGTVGFVTYRTGSYRAPGSDSCPERG